jgi:hypothetical protein
MAYQWFGEWLVLTVHAAILMFPFMSNTLQMAQPRAGKCHLLWPRMNRFPQTYKSSYPAQVRKPYTSLPTHYRKVHTSVSHRSGASCCLKLVTEGTKSHFYLKESTSSCY